MPRICKQYNSSEKMTFHQLGKQAALGHESGDDKNEMMFLNFSNLYWLQKLRIFVKTQKDTTLK